MLVEIRPMSRSARIWPIPGEIWPIPGQSWPKLADFGTKLVKSSLVQNWLAPSRKLAEFGPELVGPSGPISAPEFGQIGGGSEGGGGSAVGGSPYRSGGRSRASPPPIHLTSTHRVTRGTECRGGRCRV